MVAMVVLGVGATSGEELALLRVRLPQSALRLMGCGRGLEMDRLIGPLGGCWGSGSSAWEKKESMSAGSSAPGLCAVMASTTATGP